MKLKTCFFIVCLMGYLSLLQSYHIPSGANFGFTNILDGGPKVESPGWYWIQYDIYYHAHKFLDACAKPLGGVKSPTFNSFVAFAEILYQSKIKFLGGAPGLSFITPPIVFSKVSCNDLNLIAQKAGISNPSMHFFFQWDMINYNNRPLFIHRLGSVVYFPYGTNKYPEKTINPADILTYFDNYWANTFYFTEHWAISSRFFYLWISKNKKTKITPGAAFHMNYSMEYEVYKSCWIAINGYYLQQLHNSTQFGVEIPDSKERVFSAGPGFDFFLPHGIQLLGHVYFETKARNRTQGVSTMLNLIKYF